MKIIDVKTNPGYQVKIASGLLDHIGEEMLAVLGKPCAVAILTDDTVDALYGDRAEERLKASSFAVCRFAIPHGEGSKNLFWWGKMLEFLAENHLTRTDCILALGGGVPGDMAGFAAACYLRGIAFVQMPTTLLSMVDSSVGGKTGIDLPQGKNLAGAFYQPRLVLCDPDTLSTLPEETLLDGVAECVKYGILDDEPLFRLFAEGEWKTRLPEIIARCVEAKAEVVRLDEKDTGCRQKLNLGHTFGHAIEKQSDFAISHGKGVAIGMVMAAKLSHRLNLCDESVPRRIADCLTRVGLPTSADYSADDLLSAALSDKKRAGGKITVVLPEAVGQCGLYPVPIETFAQWMKLAAE